MKYDLERLNNIPIMDVLESLGALRDRNKKIIHCFNIGAHKNNDNNASLGIYENTNTCHCFACGVGGNPVNVVKTMFNGNFKEACEYLHSQFNIPFLNGIQATYKKILEKPQPKAKDYVFFDPNKEYVEVEKLASFVQNYSKLTKAQKLKLIYTTIYRFSLSTEQKAKNLYYLKRGIKDLSLVEKIGFLNFNNIKELENLLKKYFPMEDLIEFKIFNKEKQTWRYAFNVAFVPNFDLYSNMIVSFSLRAIDSTYNGAKEVNISCSNIVFAMPFGLENKLLKECEKVVITEGHIDCLSAKNYYSQDSKTLFISFAGTFSFREEILTIFKGKKVVLCFDKDEAGLNGEKSLSEKLNLLKITNYSLTWDIAFGKDLNDLLLANKMSSIKISA
ncbi:toprim domain-containing protein [Campylobacter sp. TTU-622]|uniref:toprim domain-containing protein n=1 Tax=Campylobacter sp. TTU-622 TaxID=2800583 RepID=UPI0019043803|nr:toprim domain-containing protein [Campylobacter sp. TTU-622]MBK1973015.1 toprim domain-containing protein [Campylobacter sp. TTU-622]